LLVGLGLAGQTAPVEAQESTKERKKETRKAKDAAADSIAYSEALADSTDFKSGYNELQVSGGASSVSSDLVDDDRKKSSLLQKDSIERPLAWYYRLKKKLANDVGLALGTDYMFLNQFSSYSASDRNATSGVFRIFGTWRGFHFDPDRGSFVFRIENRHIIGSGLTPRNLGFEAGSSLSTPSFKSFGWGITAFYWKQSFGDSRLAFAVGKMDPGDFSDVFPLLTAWKAFMSDGQFNNPSVALPQQGLGAVVSARLIERWYLTAGLHDANGLATRWGFDTFFDVREYYTWIETGWSLNKDLMSGTGIHLNLWHQDPLEASDTPESWGATFSVSGEARKQWIPFLRAGVSTGEPALVRFIVAAGTGIRVRNGGDLLGISASWTGAPDSSLRNQLSTDLFYRLQLAEHLAISPDVQITYHPSETLERDVIAVAGFLRVRISL